MDLAALLQTATAALLVGAGKLLLDVRTLAAGHYVVMTRKEIRELFSPDRKQKA